MYALDSCSIYGNINSNEYNCPSQETEVTSTPTRPVDNVVITTKGLQDRYYNNCLMERRWKIKVN